MLWCMRWFGECLIFVPNVYKRAISLLCFRITFLRNNAFLIVSFNLSFHFCLSSLGCVFSLQIGKNCYSVRCSSTGGQVSIKLCFKRIAGRSVYLEHNQTMPHRFWYAMLFKPLNLKLFPKRELEILNPFWSTFRENFPQGTQHFYHDIKHQNTPIKWIIIVRLSSWNGWISQHIIASTRWGNIILM